MTTPALSLGDQLGALLAQVPKLAERVERLERENARHQADLERLQVREVVCPKCGEDSFIILRTTQTAKRIRRRRQCRKCKHRVTTYEVID